MDQAVKILEVKDITPNVKQFKLEKPEGFKFTPGQATMVSVNDDKWKNEQRPFTFTSLNSDPFLEFTIKIYNEHHGVTDRIGSLEAGDELIIRDVWGAIEYKGPGYFIAGGAGITPFIAIFRKLYADDKIEGNVLFFSNVTDQDIILQEELEKMLGKDAVFILTGEENAHPEKINKAYLQSHITDFSKHFYVCGSHDMIAEINEQLKSLGASTESMVFDK